MDSQLRSRAQILDVIQNSVRGGSAFLFGTIMLGNAVAYAYQMLLARMMSPADYGSLVTLTSISYVLAIFVLTVEAWMVKAVSATRDAGACQIRAVFAGTMRTLVPLGGVVLAGHWLASGWVADFLHLGATTPVIALGLYTFSSFLVPVPRGMLLGLNRLYAAGAIQFLEPVARLVAGIAFVAWDLGVNGALTGYAVGNFLAFAIALVPLWPLLDWRHHQPSRVETFEGLDHYALLVLFINTGLMVMSSIDQIAVKHFFSAEVAGNYGVAFVLGRILAMSTISLGKVVFTRSATMAPGDARRARLLTKGLLVIGGIAATLTIGFLTAPALAVRLMGGSQYGTADAYVGLVGIEMTLFAFVYVQAYYHISMKKMQVVWPLCLAAVLEIALLARHHATVQQVLLILIFVMGGLLICVSGLSWWVLVDGGSRLSKVQ
jgi:O-antigen/teichoic acid export membrane protein